MKQKKTVAVFLDRDGVINRNPAEHDYVKNIGELSILPNIGIALSNLKKKGFLLIVITNQRGIARGLLSEDTLKNIHQKINEYLQQYQTSIDAFYYCPHDYKDACNCRKPLPGLVNKAIEDFDIDINKSYLIGDSENDKQVAISAGIKHSIIESNSSILNICENIEKLINE